MLGQTDMGFPLIAVVLLLGPNPMNPREVYDLCFHSQCLNNESETSSRTQRAVEKKLSRILLQPNEDHDWFSNPPRPTKCWILVLSDVSTFSSIHSMPIQI